MEVKMYYQWEIYRTEGLFLKDLPYCKLEPKSRTRRKQSKSFLIAFGKMLEALMAHPNAASPNTVSANERGTGTARVITYASASPLTMYGTEGAAGDVNYGIVVGSGTVAIALDDYDLDTPILNATLAHGQSTMGAASIVGSYIEIPISRSFVNVTGSPVTINEVGLACVTQYGSSTYAYLLLSRDLSTLEVAAGETAVCALIIRTSL